MGVFASWLECRVGDRDGDGEEPASIPGRRSCRMVGNCARIRSGSTFSTADVTRSWKMSTCTVAVDEAVDFALRGDAGEARSFGERGYVWSWSRRFGKGESGVKLVRAVDCVLAICQYFV